MIEDAPFARFAPPVRPPTALRAAITAACRREEARCMAPLLTEASLPAEDRASVRATAHRLVTALRAKHRRGGVEALVQEYALSSEEGVALMCLAESLLRIPDYETRDALIRDKIGHGDWQVHLGGTRSLFVNAATWGLVVTRELVGSVDDRGLAAALTRLVARAGEPVIRRAVGLAMRMMGEQFVAGETIDQALSRARALEAKGFTYSYDMLGEAAVSAEDAARYHAAYEHAIEAIGRAAGGRGIDARPGISIKLSALHPRYRRAQAERVMAELLPGLRRLALLAKNHDIGFSIDAEEADRLELSLDLFESLAFDPALAGWNGLGFVVQAYGKRCPFVIDWIIDLARRAGRRIMVRLVKGAYWDAEIKRAQIDGLADFPVYTCKLHTDVAYIACARRLLDARDAVFPQFATHNAQTLATILHSAGHEFTPGDYEFQCLHGMGEPLYREVVGPTKLDRPCRIYAPVGTHATLLPYLVRRLLENGANSSFVNRIADPAVAIDALIADPVEAVLAEPDPGARNPRIALPTALYPDRRNSEGIDLADETVLSALGDGLRDSAEHVWTASAPLSVGVPRRVRNPADRRDVVGTAREVSVEEVRAATARAAASRWGEASVEARAAILERAADALQAHMPALIGLAVREAGKSVANGIGEVREAVDFLRYYAGEARRSFGPARVPLGPVACISPWNFPLSIFTGQAAAALAAGNPVLAKPAEQTPLIAAEGVRLLHAAGVPEDALQLLPGDGAIGAALVEAPEVVGVVFTGSTEVARAIQAQLATRLSAEGRPIPLIAETGGQNAMIVDSSALAEQVVADVLASAFDSAGQRCSALRILCLQEEIADRTLAMLKGAFAELRVGRPDRLAVDIGPVITDEAKAEIEAHIAAMRAAGNPAEQLALPPETAHGCFVPPTIIAIHSIAQLKREVFGPVLHVIRYRREALGPLIDAINATGYGLTFGLHTRLDATIAEVTARIGAGNIYVNRGIIGATVGVQPFGGRGLSGTGPKAGGPLYLRRLTRVPPPLVGARECPPDPALVALAEWLEEEGDSRAAARARRCGERSPLGLERELPGPVGERNLYALRPRGEILIRWTTRQGFQEQLAAVLAAGGVGLVERDPPEALPPAVTARMRRAEGQNFTTALVEGRREDIIAAASEFARRPGPIVQLQAAPAHVDIVECVYEIAWLLEEVATSINTAATGGNASLLMLG